MALAAALATACGSWRYPTAAVALVAGARVTYAFVDSNYLVAAAAAAAAAASIRGRHRIAPVAFLWDR